MAFAAALVAAGVVAGLLAGLFGIGGGAVLVPVFYQTYGLLGIDDAVRMHVAVGSSLAIIIPTSLRSFAAHHAKGAVDMAVLKAFIVPVTAGVVLASLIAASISSEGLRIVFALIAFAVAFKMLFNRASWVIGSQLPGPVGTSVAGVAIGVISALMGIGGGVLNNTFMTLYGRPIHQAVATSAGVGVLISVPGIFGYMWAGWGAAGLPPVSTGYVNWLTVALIIPVTLLVAPYGAQLAHQWPKRRLEIGFGLFLLFVGARFLWSLL
ncbi:MAG: sulfite exporter TauE/SafE family protein [Sphingopyxis sp.]|nr:sulfite exporter TauE/SafE family protein [Sphingopyxis sp.]